MQRNRKILRRKNQPIKTNPKHTDVKINRQEHFKRYFNCIPYIQNVERGEYITKKKTKTQTKLLEMKTPL